MEAQIENIQRGFDNHGAYEHSFGVLKSETRYYDQVRGIDMRTNLKSVFQKGRDIAFKALTTATGGAGTAGFALIPVYVDNRIVDQSRKYTPLVEMLPRVSNQGLTADYNVITAKGGAYTAVEDAATPEKDDTYDRQSKSIKFLYSVGRVTGPSLAATPAYMMAGFQSSGSGLGGGQSFSDAAASNSLQIEVLVKARALKELEENLLLNGNSSTDSTEFDGLITQQSTTNQLDLSGVALQYEDIDKAIKLAFDDSGRPKIAVASSAAVRACRTLIVDTFRFPPTENELLVGAPPFVILNTMVGAIPLIPSQYINAAGTSGQDQIWFFDTDVIEVRVLQDMTYEELAKTNDSRKFMLKEYLCVINRATQFSAYIDNILA